MHNLRHDDYLLVFVVDGRRLLWRFCDSGVAILVSRLTYLFTYIRGKFDKNEEELSNEQKLSCIIMIIISPHRMHAMHRCGLWRQT